MAIRPSYDFDNERDDEFGVEAFGAGLTSPLAGGTTSGGPDSFQTPGYQPSYETPLSNVGGSQAQPSQEGRQPGGRSTALDSLENAIAEMGRTTDPDSRLRMQDTVARTIFRELEQFGHSVEWDGSDAIMVDGRRYEIAGADKFGGQATPNPDAPRQPQITTTRPSMTATASPTMAGDPRSFFESLIAGLPPTPASLVSLESQLGEAGIRVLRNAEGTAGKIQLPNGQIVDVILAAGAGGRGWQWLTDDGGGEPRSAPRAPMGVTSGTPLSYLSSSLVGSRPPASGFNVTAPRYVPGVIPTDDLPNFSYEQLLEGLGANDRSLDPTALDDDVTAAARRLLANPYSLDDLTIDTLKARSKDELAEMQRTSEDELTNVSYAQGWGDSPFARSLRDESRGARDRALVDSNRTIDLEAARTRKDDERQAATLGSSIAGQQFGQRLGAAQHKQQAVSTATKAVLDQAAVRGDRLALRESVNQEATRLGLSADELQLRHTIAILQDLTDRYGIDLDFEKARMQLEQRGREFVEELALRWAQLDQDDRQFGAQYGLDFARFEADERQRDFDNTNTILEGLE